MAYKTVLGLTTADKTALAARIVLGFTDAGWTVHDDMSGSSYKILKSIGESGVKTPLYLRVMWSGANVVLDAFSYWNASTHTTTAPAAVIHAGLVWGATVKLWMHGSADYMFIVIETAGAMTYHCYLGHVIALPASTVQTITSSTTGVGATTIPLTSVTGFVSGARYMIFDPTTGYRETFLCSGVGASSITVSALTSTSVYSSSSIVGTSPASFIYGSGSIAACLSINHHKTGQTNGPAFSAAVTASASSVATLFETAASAYLYSLDLPFLGTASKRVLYPPVVVEQNTTAPASRQMVGTMDDSNETLYIVPAFSSTALVNDAFVGAAFDAIYFGLQVSGTTTGSNSVTTINDTSKTWTTDQWIGKVVVCTSSTEIGQIRKIVSNTATQLTVSPDFTVIPVSGNYVISDRGYRHYLATYSFLLREGF